MATNEVTDTKNKGHQNYIFTGDVERGTGHAQRRRTTNRARDGYTDEPVIVPTGTGRRPVPDAAIVVTHSNLESAHRLATRRATFDGFNRHAVHRHAPVTPPMRPEEEERTGKIMDAKAPRHRRSSTSRHETQTANRQIDKTERQTDKTERHKNTNAIHKTQKTQRLETDTHNVRCKQIKRQTTGTDKTETETDRDRQIKTDTDTDTDRHRHRHRHRQAGSQTGRQPDTDRQTDRQTGRQTDRQTDRQAARHTDRQTDAQTAGKTDKTDSHTDILGTQPNVKHGMSSTKFQ